MTMLRARPDAVVDLVRLTRRAATHRWAVELQLPPQGPLKLTANAPGAQVLIAFVDSTPLSGTAWLNKRRISFARANAALGTAAGALSPVTDEALSEALTLLGRALRAGWTDVRLRMLAQDLQLSVDAEGADTLELEWSASGIRRTRLVNRDRSARATTITLARRMIGAKPGTIPAP